MTIHVRMIRHVTTPGRLLREYEGNTDTVEVLDYGVALTMSFGRLLVPWHQIERIIYSDDTTRTKRPGSRASSGT